MTENHDHPHENTPRCVGFILDGNRRWAEKRGFPRIAGHGWGYKKVKEAVSWVKDHNIPFIIVYGLSTENLARGKEELENFKRLGARINFIGDFTRLPPDLASRMQEVQYETATLTAVNLVIALSYGGRAEILDAVKRLARLYPPQQISRMTEKEFANYLWTGNASPPYRRTIYDPDLIIRTGGEMRLSNFLLWQSSYSELFFTPTLFPDFTREEFEKILEEFSRRKRNN